MRCARKQRATGTAIVHNRDVTMAGLPHAIDFSIAQCDLQNILPYEELTNEPGSHVYLDDRQLEVIYIILILIPVILAGFLWCITIRSFAPFFFEP
jgi:hypothetical protein